MKCTGFIFLLVFSFSGISAQSDYFPQLDNAGWESVDPQSLGWSLEKLEALKTYVAEKQTKAFVILHKGKIVVEWYFDDHSRDKNWYWASAGKTLTAGLVGIAEQQGLLGLEDQSAKYLGSGWTNCSQNEENLIKIKHQLTMTTGLNDLGNPDCTDPQCLECIATPGERWAYHNSPYTLLDGVIEGATGDNLSTYFRKNIGQKIGMNGLYLKVDYNNVFYSTALSMARYGLLLLNEGQWSGEQIINAEYVKSMHTSSQNINPSYGYLTWLNGKDQFMLPSIQIKFLGPLIPSAPADLYAGLGKNDQKMHVVPSMDLVLVRMGNAALENGKSVPIQFDEGIWEILNQVINPTTAVENMDKSESITFSQSTENLTLSSQDSKIQQMFLFDVNGRLINRTANNEMDFAGLQSGLYFLRARLIDGSIYKRKGLIIH